MNVLEAKQYLESGARNVHLVISDINMPEMSGLEFCSMICGLKGFENVPVMLVSAMSDLKTVSDGYEAGCFDYIVKPLAQESFLPKVANAVQQREKLLKFESKASKATDVAFSAMESGNQLATIIALSEKANNIKTLDKLAEEVFLTLSKFDFNASLLFNLKYRSKSFFASNGLENPLEKRTLMAFRKSHDATADTRFYDFNGRLFCIFEKAILHIKNPSEEKVDNLKDFLGSMMNFVDTKARYIEHDQTRVCERQMEQMKVAEKFEESIVELKGIFDSQMTGLNSIIDLMSSELDVKISALDLGENNERAISDIVHRAMETLENRIDSGRLAMQTSVEELIVDLHEVLQTNPQIAAKNQA